MESFSAYEAHILQYKILKLYQDLYFEIGQYNLAKRAGHQINELLSVIEYEADRWPGELFILKKKNK